MCYLQCTTVFDSRSWRRSCSLPRWMPFTQCSGGTIQAVVRFRHFAYSFFSNLILPLRFVMMLVFFRGNMRQAALCICLVKTGLDAADEHNKLHLCAQIDAVGLHQCMVDVLTFCAAHAPTGPNDEVDWTCYEVLQYLNWVLQTKKAGTDTTASRVQGNLLQQQDALFELTNHPVRTLCFTCAFSCRLVA